MEKKDRIIYRKIEETDNVYRIQATIGTRSLSLIILHEANEELLAYITSMVLEQNLKRQAEKLGLNLDDYFEKLISFFENPCKVKFQFNENVLTIVEDVNLHLHVKYFYCNLEKVKNSYIGSLIDYLHGEKSNSEIQCDHLMSENELLKKDVVEYKKKLNELVERKIIDEQTMLSNFVLLLNEKKIRIQHLNELLEAFNKNPSLADPVEVNVNKKKRKLKNTKFEEQLPKVKEEISESDSGDALHDNITDDEHSSDPSKSENMASKYIDLFDESPTEEDLSIIKFPNSTMPENLPSTSKGVSSDSDLKPRENDKPSINESPDCEEMNIDTQEWLENF